MEAPAAGAGAAAAKQWAGNEWLLASSTVLLLISLFLPWFGVTQQRTRVYQYAVNLPEVTGTSQHGYLWLAFALCLVILALLVLRPALEQVLDPARERLPLSLPGTRQLLLSLAVLNFVVVLVAFLAKPGNGQYLSASGISVGWRYAAVAALVLAAVAALAAILGLRRPTLVWG